MRSHLWLVLAGLIAITLLAACGTTRPAADPPVEDSPGPQSRPLFATPAPRPQATVVDLVDGDTLVLSVDGSEVPVRLIAIDAPEADLNQCFATAASAFVAAVAPPGAILELETDVSEVDAYGRLLRYAYLPDGSMLNEQLVRGGFARVTPEPPDQKYIERLREAEDQAKRDGVGLWSECEESATPTPEAVVQATAVITPDPTAAAAFVSQPTATPTLAPTATRTPAPAATASPTPAPTAVATPSATATPLPTPAPTPIPTVAPTPAPTAAPPPAENCDPSYPTVCIPPAPPDLDCGDIPFRRFTVLQPDPHRFDGDKDGVGCES